MVRGRRARAARPRRPVSAPFMLAASQVYDVTPYVDEHPGGVAAILKNAGGDSTKGFHGPQHPARVFDMIGDYCIGTLVPEK